MAKLRFWLGELHPAFLPFSKGLEGRPVLLTRRRRRGRRQTLDELHVGWITRRPVLGIAERAEIHETAQPARMLVAQGGQLTSCHRVTHQHGRRNVQVVEHLENVVCKPLVVITGRRLTGVAIATAGDAVDVTAVGEASGAKSSKMCAVLPEPASSTMARPEPPESSTSSRTPASTETNLNSMRRRVSPRRARWSCSCESWRPGEDDPGRNQGGTEDTGHLQLHRDAPPPSRYRSSPRHSNLPLIGRREARPRARIDPPPRPEGWSGFQPSLVVRLQIIGSTLQLLEPRIGSLEADASGRCPLLKLVEIGIASRSARCQGPPQHSCRTTTSVSVLLSTWKLEYGTNRTSSSEG